MKSKLAGLVILLCVIAAGCIYYFGFASRPETLVINGYLGGEKIGLLEDEQVQEILEERYHLRIDYSRAGSLEMISADLTGRDYLFPSSPVALEMYRETVGDPVSSEIIFNTPIVLYTYKEIADAFDQAGYLTDLGDGVRGIQLDMLARDILDGKQWADIGMDSLYGPMTVSTTDPVKSNSGNMFAGLLANVLAPDGVADMEDLDQILPELKEIFEKSGYMESSSSDLFQQFLNTGMGARPVMAGYESQILEFAAQNPQDWEVLKDEIVMLYPVPTVWSSHPYIALNENGALAAEALMDGEIQQIAWEKHGFRTGVSGAAADTSRFDVSGLASVVNQVVSMPDYEVMARIIEELS